MRRGRGLVDRCKVVKQYQIPCVVLVADPHGLVRLVDLRKKSRRCGRGERRDLLVATDEEKCASHAEVDVEALSLCLWVHKDCSSNNPTRSVDGEHPS